MGNNNQNLAHNLNNMSSQQQNTSTHNNTPLNTPRNTPQNTPQNILISSDQLPISTSAENLVQNLTKIFSSDNNHNIAHLNTPIGATLVPLSNNLLQTNYSIHGGFHKFWSVGENFKSSGLKWSFRLQKSYFLTLFQVLFGHF